MWHLAWAIPLSFCLGFLAAGWFYRLGVRDALLGLPHPRELVGEVVSIIREGRDPLKTSTLYDVKEGDEYGN